MTLGISSAFLNGNTMFWLRPLIIIASINSRQHHQQCKTTFSLTYTIYIKLSLLDKFIYLALKGMYSGNSLHCQNVKKYPPVWVERLANTCHWNQQDGVKYWNIHIFCIESLLQGWWQSSFTVSFLLDPQLNGSRCAFCWTKIDIAKHWLETECIPGNGFHCYLLSWVGQTISFLQENNSINPTTHWQRV